MTKQTIGFIGTGVMGKSMAHHLIKAGYPVHVYTRTKNKAEQLIQEGATWKNSIKDIAQTSDVVITMIGTPTDVEEVYFGEDGLLHHMQPESYVIDMTTSKPSLAIDIYNRAKEKNIYALDAPVSGGDIGAKNAKLTIMVGGDKQPFDNMKPILQQMGENIRLQGPAGSGQHTKAVNQISIAPGMIGLCEALIYAMKAGLDPKEVLRSISTGAAGSWSMDNYAPRMIDGNFDPGFAIKHFIKDMNIAVEAAQEMNVTMPGVELALNMYKKLEENGEGENGIHALLKYYDL